MFARRTGPLNRLAPPSQVAGEAGCNMCSLAAAVAADLIQAFLRIVSSSFLSTTERLQHVRERVGSTH